MNDTQHEGCVPNTNFNLSTRSLLGADALRAAKGGQCKYKRDRS